MKRIAAILVFILLLVGGVAVAYQQVVTSNTGLISTGQGFTAVTGVANTKRNGVVWNVTPGYPYRSITAKGAYSNWSGWWYYEESQDGVNFASPKDIAGVSTAALQTDATILVRSCAPYARMCYKRKTGMSAAHTATIQGRALTTLP